MNIAKLLYIYIYQVILECYVIYIPWLRGVYQQYEMQALRYLPSASPRADIKGRGSDIADTHQEDMVHNYNIFHSLL